MLNRKQNDKQSDPDRKRKIASGSLGALRLPKHNMDANEQFRRLLKELGWNQEEAATKLGKSRIHINRIANDHVPPGHTLIRVMELEVELQRRTNPAVRRAEADLEEIGQALRQLKPAKRKSVMSCVAKLIAEFV